MKTYFTSHGWIDSRDRHRCEKNSCSRNLATLAEGHKAESGGTRTGLGRDRAELGAEWNRAARKKAPRSAKHAYREAIALRKLHPIVGSRFLREWSDAKVTVARASRWRLPSPLVMTRAVRVQPVPPDSGPLPTGSTGGSEGWTRCPISHWH